MKKYCNEKLKQLEQELQELTITLDDPILISEMAIRMTLVRLSELKEFVRSKGFKQEAEEIYFFKVLKPNILAKLIYHNAVYKIETRKPYGDKQIKAYLRKELQKLKRFFNHNLDFYKYYRSNNTFLDKHFFVRGRHNISLWLDTFYFEADHCFATSHDYKVAKIIANDLIQVYIEDQLHTLQQKGRSSARGLQWTASKTALTELIYALYAGGVLNNGNADIKQIAQTFETTFGISLGDFYHTFMELKSRKINRTKFLNTLSEALVNKMDKKDEL